MAMYREREMSGHGVPLSPRSSLSYQEEEEEEEEEEEKEEEEEEEEGEGMAVGLLAVARASPEKRKWVYEAPPAVEFEFCNMGQTRGSGGAQSPRAMSSADELFSDGKLRPLAMASASTGGGRPRPCLSLAGSRCSSPTRCAIANPPTAPSSPKSYYYANRATMSASTSASASLSTSATRHGFSAKSFWPFFTRSNSAGENKAVGPTPVPRRSKSASEGKRGAIPLVSDSPTTAKGKKAGSAAAAIPNRDIWRGYSERASHQFYPGSATSSTVLRISPVLNVPACMVPTRSKKGVKKEKPFFSFSGLFSRKEKLADICSPLPNNPRPQDLIPTGA